MKFLCFLVLTLSLLGTAPFDVEAGQSSRTKTTVEKKKHRATSQRKRVTHERRQDHRQEAKSDRKRNRSERRSVTSRSSRGDEDRSVSRIRRAEKRRMESRRARLSEDRSTRLSRRDRRRLRHEAQVKRHSYAMSRRSKSGRYSSRHFRAKQEVASLDYIQPFEPERTRTSTSWMDDDGNQLAGKASWYGRDFHGGKTASGLRYDMYTFTAAHRTLPLGTVVKVTTLDEGKSVMVCVTDRGPYVRGRIIDLSYAAANQLGLEDKGVGEVNLEIVCDKDGKPLKKRQAFFVQYKARKGNEKAGPFKEFADACAMQEALRQAHPDAKVILGSTR